MVKRGMRKNQLYLFAILIVLILVFSFVLYENGKFTGRITSPSDSPGFPYLDSSYGSCNGMCEGSPNEQCYCDPICLSFGDCCHDYNILLCDNPCKQGEIFCRNNPTVPGVCCDESTSKCGTIGELDLDGIYGDDANICVPKDKTTKSEFCDKNSPGNPQECTYGGLTICCKEYDICTYVKFGGGFFGTKIPVCQPADDSCKPGDKNYCGPTAESTLCCRENEKCVTKKSIIGDEERKYCTPAYCNVILKETLCYGTGKFGPDMPFETSLCCSSEEKCTHQPNGAPKCEKIPTTIAQCGNGILETGEICDAGSNSECGSNGQKCKTDCTGYETCQAKNDCSDKCGDYDPLAECQCDTLCIAAGDCCPEYEEVCGMATG